MAPHRALVCCCLLLSFGWPSAQPSIGGPEEPIEAGKAEPFKTEVLRLPMKVFAPVDPKDPTGVPKLLPGVHLLPNRVSQNAEPKYDVKGFLTSSMGLSLPPEAEAIYFPSGGVFILRAPESMVDGFLDSFNIDRFPDDPPVSMRHTFAIVEFPAGDSDNLAKLGYAALRKKFGSSWHELQSVTFNAGQGWQTAASNVTASGKAGVSSRLLRAEDQAAVHPPSEELQAGEKGIRCVVEPMVSPDGRECDVSYSLQWRVSPGDPVSKLAAHIKLWEDRPVVLQIVNLPLDPASKRPARREAIIFSVHLMNFGDWREGAKPPLEKRSKRNR